MDHFYLGVIVLRVNKISVMSAKKRTMACSQSTQPQRPKRFIRQNSGHTLKSRSGTLNKSETSPDPRSNTPTLQKPPVLQSNKSYLDQQTVIFFKKSSQPISMGLRRNTGSMRMDRGQTRREREEILEKEVKALRDEKELLIVQGNRLRKMQLQDQEARRVLQEEVSSQREAIRNLEKRVFQLKDEKKLYHSQKERLLQQIQRLESQTRIFHRESRALEGEYFPEWEECSMGWDLHESRIQYSEVTQRGSKLQRELSSLKKLSLGLQNEIKNCSKVQQGQGREKAQESRNLKLDQKYKQAIKEIKSLRKELYSFRSKKEGEGRRYWTERPFLTSQSSEQEAEP